MSSADFNVTLSSKGRVLLDPDSNVFTRQIAVDSITTLIAACPEYLDKIPTDAIRGLLSILHLHNDEQTDDEVNRTLPILQALSTLCKFDTYTSDSPSNTSMIQQYRVVILYDNDVDTAHCACTVTRRLTTNLLLEEDHVDMYSKYDMQLLSALRTFVSTLLCFIPLGSLVGDEPDWYQRYGARIMDTLCDCARIEDRSVLGDVCQALGRIYILSSYNHSAGAMCIKSLKRLYNDGRYRMVKQAAKNAVMSIVIEYYMRQGSSSQRCPTDIAFRLWDYIGSV